MSRRIVIQGGAKCLLEDLAEETAAELGGGLRYDKTQHQFVYEGLDDNYEKLVERAEARYGLKLRDHRERQVLENARKRGFSCKKEAQADGKIRIVLTRRVYE